jgi:hypothetical protein
VTGPQQPRQDNLAGLSRLYPLPPDVEERYQAVLAQINQGIGDAIVERARTEERLAAEALADDVRKRGVAALAPVRDLIRKLQQENHLLIREGAAKSQMLRHLLAEWRTHRETLDAALHPDDPDTDNQRSLAQHVRDAAARLQPPT